MKFLRRFVYRREDELFNPLMWPWLLQTFSFGLAFIFFGWSDTVQASILYSLTSVHYGLFATSLWGILAVVAILLTLINLGCRSKTAGTLAGTLGISLWMYAAILYVTTGFYFQAALAIPPLYFWIWHSLRISKYYNTIGRYSTKESAKTP